VHYLPHTAIKILKVSQQCTDMMTISSARERTNNQDDMFEKDCSEAIGFQDGFKPYKDL
jgi:hypothetical protein